MPGGSARGGRGPAALMIEIAVALALSPTLLRGGSLDPTGIASGGVIFRSSGVRISPGAPIATGWAAYRASSMPPGYSPAMTRRRRNVIAFVAMLAMAFQAPVIAVATAMGGGDSVMATPASHSAASGNSCCPGCPSGAVAASCCLGVCWAGSAIAASPLPLCASARPQAPAVLESSPSLTRSDVPLIRPPIS